MLSFHSFVTCAAWPNACRSLRIALSFWRDLHPKSPKPFGIAPLNLQSRFARTLGHGFDPAVIHVAAAIEHDFLDAGGKRPFRNLLADGLRRFDSGARLQAVAIGLLQRRSGDERPAGRIVDDLAVDLQRRTMHGEARPAIGARLDRPSDPCFAALRRVITLRHLGAPSNASTAWRPSALFLLAFLAEDEFVGIFHALALIGLGRTQCADFGGDLPDLLAIDAGDRDLRRLRR